MKKITVAGSVIIEDKKLLVILDGQKVYKTPGGKKEENESHEQIVKRETMEEVGAEVDVKELVNEYFIGTKEKKYYLFNYRAILKTRPKITPEIKEFKWIGYDESKNLKLSSNVKTLIELLHTKGEM